MPQASATRTAKRGSLIIVSTLERPAERAAHRGRTSKSALDVVRYLKPCCAEIAEVDPILLQSSKMRARDRKIACRSMPRHSQLPASTITLYTMTRLKRDVLEAELKSGGFNPKTTCEQVRALLPPTKPKNPRPGLIKCGSSCANIGRRRRLNSPKTQYWSEPLPRKILEIIEAAKQRRRGRASG
jgi:hypothetical protein